MPNLLLCADEYSNSYRVLILAKGTAVPKSFIVPLFALQAPAPVFSWIQYVIDSCILLSCLVYIANCFKVDFLMFAQQIWWIIILHVH